MKICPNCKLELPDEAHFCPRCMFQYEKIELKAPKCLKRRQRIFRISLVTGIVAVCLFVVVSFALRKAVRDYEALKAKQTLDIQTIIDENFRMKDKFGYNSEIETDLRDMLTFFDESKGIFGEETAEKYTEDGFDVYTYGIVTVVVNERGMIQNIVVEYADGKNDRKIGIFGIDNRMSRDDVIEMLGVPEQEYKAGKEICYRFIDGQINPSLYIVFDDYGMVETLDYYFVD